MDPATLISALAPVLLVLGLGYAAGKHRSFDDDQTRGLSHLALTYALPAVLFLSMAHFDRATLLAQAPFAVVMLAGYSGLYLCLYGLLRVESRSSPPGSSLHHTGQPSRRSSSSVR